MNSALNRTSEAEEWFCTFPEELEELEKTWKRECIKTAQLIHEGSNLPINILFSGGLDSNVVVEVFRLAKVPFSVVTMKMNKGKNFHDIKHAIDYCKYYNIKQTFVDADIEKLLENTVPEIAEKIQCRSPQFATLCWLIDQVDGLPIVCNGELDISEGEIIYEGEQYQFIEKWLAHRGRQGVAKFFKFRLELKLSQMLDNFTFDWLRKNRDRSFRGKRVDQFKTVKHLQYQRFFPNLMPRPKLRFEGVFTKDGRTQTQMYHSEYNGFEYVLEEEQRCRRILEKNKLFGNQIVPFKFMDMLDWLLSDSVLRDTKLRSVKGVKL